MNKQPLMKAVGLLRYLPIDQPESLIDVTLPKPVPVGRDLLVKVMAVSVNPVDTKVRSPKDHSEKEPRILGFDAAGVVELAGPDCTLFKPGDEVYYSGSIARSGSNSEFQLVDERIVGFKPAALDFAEAAALPLTGITAWEALYDRLGISGQQEVNRHKTILIIGAAGGVGSIATQLASHAELTVIGTASRPETVEWAKRHGAAHVIDHYEPLAPQLKALGYPHVNYILCLNDTDRYWAQMAEVIAPQGMICSIVETKEPVNISLLKNKSAAFVWEFMFTRAMYETPDMVQQHHLLNRISELVDDGTLHTTLTERISPIHAANLRLAHAKLEAGSMIGKLVVEGWGEE
ncbi:zinc-binding alcohol dehydrogenase family protein [Paenibacillus mendelii]|uniref:Zinc-type alcohol dehydrogenase-like protein n=1 Tax=Paenibacillus mendelii TaxID=206163 RepID=A0ABV6JM20_9BACL|nr:zinc-binding alcohol dehydrogenase family protein [Paenibacillus mendelii]MCQ6558776.1 zinc-binding alcohol dehydrogenase family protein [Paenibacillus mendelii]